MSFLEMISRPEIWGVIFAVVIAFNAFLVALYKALDKLDQVIPGDQKPVVKGLKTLTGFLKKIIDIFGHNTRPQ